jgi:hypothetical protein
LNARRNRQCEQSGAIPLLSFDPPAHLDDVRSLAAPLKSVPLRIGIALFSADSI